MGTRKQKVLVLHPLSMFQLVGVRCRGDYVDFGVSGLAQYIAAVDLLILLRVHIVWARTGCGSVGMSHSTSILHADLKGLK